MFVKEFEMEFESILSYGAVADGKSDCTAAFREALSGGKAISIGKGTFLTGPFKIGSNTTLRVEKGARVLFIADQNIYEPVYTRWEGVNCYAMHPCVFISDAENVSIEGEGVFDGNGGYWWDLASYKKHGQAEPETDVEKKFASLNPDYKSQPGGGGGRQCQFLRPPLLQTLNSKNIRISGISLQNSPFWTLHPVYTDHLEIGGISIKNPYDSPNTDGIDIDSCTNVTVKDCIVEVGDDGIALKSGSGDDGIKTGRITENVHVSNCKVFKAHGGIVVGSETAAGIRNIVAERCEFIGTDRGIRIKTRRGRGGKIENLVFRSLEIIDNLCPIAINMYYRCGADDSTCFSLDKLDVVASTPSIRNIKIENCHAEGSRASNGFIVGLPEMPITGLEIKDCSFSLAKEPSSPIEDSEMYEGLPVIKSRAVRLRNVEAEIKNVSFTGTEDAFFVEEGCTIR